jgi:adenylate cyclase
LLNRHFTAMTDIVLDHHGTVARFIGDAIMAFWGAPLDDDDQAWRAVAAAVAMQQGMVGLRGEFEREGLPPIYMRVGIHSGSAIVGNLGSAKRFDYTAIGDDVNIAARLEGTNKYYATEILVSGEIVMQVGERIRFRPVDKVIVKGKTRAIEIFTPCDDATLVALTAQAIALFRGREWDAADRVCGELLAHAPGDYLGQMYLQRIARFRVEPPGDGWDGAVEVEK